MFFFGVKYWAVCGCKSKCFSLQAVKWTHWAEGLGSGLQFLFPITQELNLNLKRCAVEW